MPQTLLETFIAGINANAFFPEFTFAATEFPVPGQGERELADHIVLVGETGLIFQLKERDASAPATEEAVQKWFDGKVRKKAVSQLRDTRQMLREFGGMQLRNQADQLVQVDPPDINRLVGVVVYKAPVRLPLAPRLYPSESAGLVHFIPDEDYAEICRVLKTPVEITDYLEFRARMVTTNPEASAAGSERALIGQFLSDDGSALPSMKFEAVFEAWLDDESSYDLSFMLRKLGSRIISLDGAPVPETSHHHILREFAMLSRSELAMFKSYLRLSLDAVRQDRYLQEYRMLVPRTDCGFLVIPLTSEMAPDARRFLENMGSVSKHAFGSTRHLSLNIVSRNGALDIEWMHAVGAPQADPVLDAYLAEHWPFRRSSPRSIPRYMFDTDALNQATAP